MAACRKIENQQPGESSTVPLHSPLGLYKGTVAGVCKTVGIPTGHVSP